MRKDSPDRVLCALLEPALNKFVDEHPDPQQIQQLCKELLSNMPDAEAAAAGIFIHMKYRAADRLREGMYAAR